MFWEIIKIDFLQKQLKINVISNITSEVFDIFLPSINIKTDNISISTKHVISKYNSKNKSALPISDTILNIENKDFKKMSKR